MTSSSHRRALVLGVAAALVLPGCGGEEFVAEFGCESPEQQVVEGNLLIASPEDVASCSSLVEVEGRLRVAGFDPIADGAEYHSGNDRLKNLRGLEGLVRVGSLVVENNEALQSLDGLDSLGEAGTVRVQGNDRLADVTALESIKAQGFAFRGNEGLQTVAGIADNDALPNGLMVSGMPSVSIPDLTLGEASIVTFNELPLLTRLPGFGPAPKLEKLNLLVMPLIDSVAPLTTIERVEEVNLSGLGLPSLVELSDWDPQLRKLLLAHMPLQSLSGLEHISVLDELSLYMLTDLQSLSALENLREIRGDLMINRLDALEALDFPALERVDGNVEITENPRLSKAAIDDFLERVEITGEVRDCLNATQKPCF